MTSYETCESSGRNGTSDVLPFLSFIGEEKQQSATASTQVYEISFFPSRMVCAPRKGAMPMMVRRQPASVYSRPNVSLLISTPLPSDTLMNRGFAEDRLAEAICERFP
jgi:hypothetical protein